jgi:hypothetical protein
MSIRVHSRLFLYPRASAFIRGSFFLVRAHSRSFLFVSIRGIETLNDADESLFHGGIR